ncbi:MAG: FAD-binding oxidoreductase [Abditibacteriota bacterium]|nr:FAD-binding oxidoreductase [Abditibacteriota bacterium]
MAELLTFNDDYKDYITDESKTIGRCDFITFPKNKEDIIQAFKYAKDNNLKVTIQGGKTGIVAGSVPNDGILINLSKFNKILNFTEKEDYATLDCEPGCLLSEIRECLKNTDYFFPNDPTETSASIGGMVVCNASGALSYSYNSIRPWILGLEIILPNGETLNIERGLNFTKGLDFSIQTNEGSVIQGKLPQIHHVDIKSAAGYYIRKNMDLIDLFIGSEGTLGTITKIKLKLIPKKEFITGIVVFLSSENEALTFVQNIRGEKEFEDLKADAIEFFNESSLSLVNKMKKEREMFSELNTIKPEYKSAIYIEFQRNTEEETNESIESLYEIFESMNISDEDTWCAFTEEELKTLKLFRHAIPESVNTLIGEIKRNNPTITKLSTDMSVPNDALEYVFDLYNKSLTEAGLTYVIFGHIGNNHLHVNVIPHNEEEYNKGKELYKSWAKFVVDCGGSVSAEHGIGKLKKDFFKIMFSEDEIKEMKAFRKLFDKEHILNIGNIFD